MRIVQPEVMHDHELRDDDRLDRNHDRRDVHHEHRVARVPEESLEVTDFIGLAGRVRLTEQFVVIGDRKKRPIEDIVSRRTHEPHASFAPYRDRPGRLYSGIGAVINHRTGIANRFWSG